MSLIDDLIQEAQDVLEECDAEIESVLEDRQELQGRLDSLKAFKTEMEQLTKLARPIEKSPRQPYVKDGFWQVEIGDRMKASWTSVIATVTEKYDKAWRVKWDDGTQHYTHYYFDEKSWSLPTTYRTIPEVKNGCWVARAGDRFRSVIFGSTHLVKSVNSTGLFMLDGDYGNSVLYITEWQYVG